MRALVVGAGAVGQVFGLHLQRGGAQVSFFVKEEHAEAARAGFTLFDLSRGGARARLDGCGVHTSASALDGGWDLVLLCVASPALRAGAWLEEVVAATAPATVAGLQPGLGDAALVRRVAGDDRVVWGVIELIAYQSPLPGASSDAEPGVAFWTPWWLPLPFSGPRAPQVVEALRAGGLRARQVPDTEVLTATGAPVMNLHIAALEVAGWRLDALRRDRALLELTAAAVRQAVAVAAREHGVPVPAWTRLLRPWQARLLARVAPRAVPLDLEPYLRFHFTKVRAQTREQLDRWIRLAGAHDQPHDALIALRSRLT